VRTATVKRGLPAGGPGSGLEGPSSTQHPSARHGSCGPKKRQIGGSGAGVVSWPCACAHHHGGVAREMRRSGPWRRPEAPL